MKLCPVCGLLNNSVNTHCPECKTAFKFKPYKPKSPAKPKAKPKSSGASASAEQMKLWGDPKTKDMT